ncbi:MAG: HAMP domain-containing protein [Cyanobacteria bacterium J06597_16]
MTTSDLVSSSESMPVEPLAAEHHKALGIKASLVGAVLITITLTASIVYIPWALTSKRNLKTIVAQTNGEIVLGASQEVKRLLGSARTANDLIQNSFYHDLIDFEDPQTREAFFLSILESNPDFTWIQLGYENGDFLGAQRLPNGKLRTHFRDWDESTRTTLATLKTYVSLARDANIVEAENLMNPPFYAPSRPWYTAALEQPPGEQAWSVYLYRTTQRPGVDATITLSRGEEVYGVAGVGIGLGQLSQFLRKEMWHQNGGEVFILNADHEILASTDLSETSHASRGIGAGEILPLSKAVNPLLQQVHSALSAPDNLKILEIGNLDYTDQETGENYYISLSSLDYLGWKVGTIVPADVYLGKIQRERQILLGVISLFIITTAGLAILLSDRLVARPILTVAQAASDIESETFEVGSLSRLAHRKDEFGQLARVFQEMARQVAVRQQKLKKQVTALKVEIDDVKRQQQVKEIVETDFFQDLTTKAQNLRQRSSNRKS